MLSRQRTGTLARDCDLPRERHRCIYVGYYFDVPGTCADGAYTVLKIREMVKLHVCLEGWLLVKKPLRKDACWAVLGLIKYACVHHLWPVIAERDRQALEACAAIASQVLGVTCCEEPLITLLWPAYLTWIVTIDGQPLAYGTSSHALRGTLGAWPLGGINSK